MADLVFTIEFNSNGEPVLKNIGGVVDDAKRRFGGLVPEANKTEASMRPLSSAIGLVAGNLGALGPEANAATNALLQLQNGIGPVTIGLAAAVATFGILTRRIQETRENLAALAEIELNQVQRETKNLGLEQRLKLEERALASLEPELEQVRIKHELLQLAIDKVENAEQRLVLTERNAHAASLELGNILNTRLEAAAKAQQAIQAEISARQFETAALGRSGAAVDALSLAQRLNALDARIMAGEHGALIAQLKGEEIAAFKLKTALDQINTGRSAIGQFQQQFGVQLDFDFKKSGVDLASKFASVFNAFKDDPRAAAQLNAAFASLVQQAVQLGLPDIPELLLSVGLNETDINQLKSRLAQRVIGTQTIEESVPQFGTNAFGGPVNLGTETITREVDILGQDLVRALESSQQAGQQWGAAFETEFSNATERAGAVGESVTALARRFDDLTVAAARELSLNVDASAAIAEASELKELILSIPERRTVVLDVQTNAAQALFELESLYSFSTGLTLGSQVFS